MLLRSGESGRPGGVPSVRGDTSRSLSSPLANSGESGGALVYSSPSRPSPHQHVVVHAVEESLDVHVHRSRTAGGQAGPKLKARCSSGVRAPWGRSFTCCFLLQAPHSDAVAVRLAAPAIEIPEDLQFQVTSSLPESLSLSVAVRCCLVTIAQDELHRSRAVRGCRTGDRAKRSGVVIV